MKNYCVYLKGHASKSGPSKEELKLRTMRQSKCSKKNAEALTTLPSAEYVGINIPHLEEVKIFGSTKRKLDIPIGDVEKSHRLNKVNFS